MLDDNKAQDLVLLDVRGICTITDYFLLATGGNTPHLRALAEDVEVSLKKEGARCVHRSGTTDSGWLVVDYFDVVIHLFSADMREYYDLERLWSDAIVVTPPHTKISPIPRAAGGETAPHESIPGVGDPQSPLCAHDAWPA